LTEPRAGVNPPLSRILIGMHDCGTGLDQQSFRVTADFALDGMPAGENLARLFKPRTPGVWELALTKPLTPLPRGQLKVSVKDRQGNLTSIERTFSVEGAAKP
jgi:hypothetical protein